MAERSFLHLQIERRWRLILPSIEQFRGGFFAYVISIIKKDGIRVVTMCMIVGPVELRVFRYYGDPQVMGQEDLSDKQVLLGLMEMLLLTW